MVDLFSGSRSTNAIDECHHRSKFVIKVTTVLINTNQAHSTLFLFTERLFNRVAPMGVNDIAMACQYKFGQAPPLDIPITSFDGLADNTIDPGAERNPIAKIVHLFTYSLLGMPS